MLISDGPPAVRRSGAGQGRCAVAQQELRPGEVIWRSPPLAVILHDQYRGQRCDRCFCKGSRALQRCGRCKETYYCSRSCQEADWKTHHKLECPARPLLKKAFSTAGLHGTDVIQDALLASRCLRTGHGQHGAGALEDLESSKDFMKPEEQAQLKTVAETMARATPQLAASCDAIFDALTRFGNNNFAVTDDLFLAVGAGCFPVGAALNHCCRPNCLLAYELAEGQLPVQAVRVLEPVLAGEELVHSYVDLALPRGQRLEQLKETYGFECSCIGCTDPLPEVERLMELELAPGDPASSAELARAEQLRLQAATEEDAEMELKILEEVCGLRERWLHPRHLEVCAAHAAAHTAAMAAFDWVAAERHCGKLVEQYQAVYPSWHPITGLQLFTLAELKEQLGKSEEAYGCYQGAEGILRLTHGEDHDLVLQLRERLAENKMKPTNPNADTYVEKQRLNIYLSQFPANNLVEHPDLTH